MAWELLPTNYTDAIWAGLKKYNMLNNPDGTISLQDVTIYTGRENSFFGALDANRMNHALNTIMSMVENGTDLYEAFQLYFEKQELLFEGKADAEYQEFKKYLFGILTEGQESLDQIAERAAASERAAKVSETAAKGSQEAAKNSETAAKTSEEAAIAAKNTAVAAKTAAEYAQTAAETAQTGAETSARTAQEAAQEAKDTVVKTPYVGENGHWFVWDTGKGMYTDTDIPAQGNTGPTGPQGIQGPPGPQGVSGVAVVADGHYAFNVNSAGHLIVSYTGSEAPNLRIDSATGHLILTL